MDFITKVISKFSPAAAARRLRSTVALNMMEAEIRRYDGAGYGRRFDNRLDQRNVSTNHIIDMDLVWLRTRSREAGRNNPYAKRGLRVIATNVVGTGIIMTPKHQSKKKALDLKLAAIWADWAGTTDCDFYGQNNIYGLQKMIMLSVAKNGESIVRRVQRRYKEGTIPFQLQVLEPEFLDQTKTAIQINDGGYIQAGVQFDKNGKRIGYWIYDRHPYDFTAISGFVKEDEILHVYDVEDAGQVRGVPFTASILLRMKDFDDFQDAQMLKQKVAACFSAFITEADVSKPQMPNNDDKPGITKLEPGLIRTLKQGETITFGTPPSTEGYSDFSRQSLLGQSAGLGISYEALTNDMSNVNFSSGRMGWIESQKNVDDWQWNLLIPQFCEKSFAWFLKFAFLKGLIPDTNYKATWTCPRREMIDPVKETKALVEQVRAGFISWQEAVRMLGFIPEEIVDELIRDRKMIDEAGIMPTSDPRFDPSRTPTSDMPPGTSGKNPVAPTTQSVQPKPKKVKKTAN